MLAEIADLPLKQNAKISFSHNANRSTSAYIRGFQSEVTEVTAKKSVEIEI